MIDYTQALHRLLAHTGRLSTEHCPLASAPGRVLAQPVASPIALPSFDHAAMDGYALAAREPLPAGSEHAVHGSQAAGDAARASVGQAWEIMTGAHLPDGLDAVVAVERTELLARQADGTPARIRLLDPLEAGHNVRCAGSDVGPGDEVLAAGTRIEAAQVMLLAALGVAQVELVRRPRIAIVCTGKELQADPTQPLADGRIHNSNGPYLVAALTAGGAQVLSCDTVDDTAATYAAAVRRAAAAGVDLVVSTGAVSKGRYDFVPDTLRELGADLLFHKVAIRPGKPILGARLADGPLLLALPGTPMAVAVGLRFFIAPVLRAMAGQGSEPALHAVLDTPQQPKPGLRHFLRAQLHQDPHGRLHASIPGQQQPYRILPFAHADAWVVLPEDAGDCALGTRVAIASLHSGQPPAFSAVL
jgi:molybdopterin molybdotransferase